MPEPAGVTAPAAPVPVPATPAPPSTAQLLGQYATPLVQSNGISSSANNSLCSIAQPWTGCGGAAVPAAGWSEARPTMGFDRNMSQAAYLYNGGTSGFQNQLSLSPSLQ